MKTTLISKIIISNLIVLFFVLGTFVVIQKYTNNDFNTILEKRKNIALFNSEINKVASNLYQSSNLHDNKYLAKAAISSNEALRILNYLQSVGFETKEIKSHYMDFFKNTVITTSMLLEERLDEARTADIISSKKYEILQAKMKELVILLDNEQSSIATKVMSLMIVATIISILIVVGNIIYLINSYNALQKKQNELQNIKINALEKEKEIVLQRATMIDAIGDGVYGVQRNGLCTFINKSALEMLGFSKDEILGTHQHHLFHHHKIDNSIYPEEECPIHHSVMDKQKRVCKEYFITKAGKFIPVSLTVSPMGNDGAVVVFRDISENERYEEKLKLEVAKKTKELEDLNENLEQKVIFEVGKNKKQQALLEQQSRLAALGEMIGNIAHQWRQPLSVITTVMSGLKLKKDFGLPVTNEDIIETSEEIIKNANFLSHTIDDFRNFIKNDKKKEKFKIADVITNTVNLLSASIKSNHIVVYVENIDDSIFLEGYPNELAQIILNLINNSKDVFSSLEIQNKVIKISLTRVDTRILLRISDNAGGVPADIKDKIFDPYFTTKHQSQGTGLGLYMSANILRQHFNGKIYYENCEQTIENITYNGSTFIIELPFEAV